MSSAVRLSGLVVVFAALGLATACTDPQSPKLAANLLPTGGTLAAATTTNGSDVDPNGYEVWVDDQASQPSPDNGIVVFQGLSGGDHKVALLLVAANCVVTARAPGTELNNPRTVTIVEGVTGGTEYDVGCSSVGSLFISTTTTGVDLDADGYTVTVDGASQLAATNGDATFTGVATGTHSVALSGVAGNCTVSGGNAQTATVTAGGMANVAFSVSCTPIGSGSGSLTVITSTTGFNLDPDGYTLTIDGTSSQAMALNDTVTAAVPAGANPVALSGVAANCTVSGANPRTVTVTAGGAGTTTFAVTCGAQPPAAVSGQGKLGWEAATPGNHVQTFEVDIRADLTGRFTVTDFGNILASGEPAMLTTDPANDPETNFIAYRDPGASRCEEPGDGVEIEGVGRLNDADGTLLTYTLQLCNNGQLGSGPDYVSLFLPVNGYGRSGVLTAGDVAKR